MAGGQLSFAISPYLAIVAPPSAIDTYASSHNHVYMGDLALFGIRLLEQIGLKPPITTDNLLGIKYLHQFDPVDDLARLGLKPLSFQESLLRLQRK